MFNLFKRSKKDETKDLRHQLIKPREGFFSKLKQLLLHASKIDTTLFEELEELLIQSDMSARMTMDVIDELEAKVEKEKITTTEGVYECLKSILTNKLTGKKYPPFEVQEGLNVILVVGVNGVGKTTTIGKLALQAKESGHRVVIGAADTFRAAAVDQLEIWSQRAGVSMIRKEDGSDPGAVVYETLQQAKEMQADVVIIDTAGRLQNKAHLMAELAKLNRIILKESGASRYEKLLVIDATTGQNALSQTDQFNEAVSITGVVLTKFDGTAKGGVIFNIAHQYHLPIRYLGVGEGVDDLVEFNTETFIEAIFN